MNVPIIAAAIDIRIATTMKEIPSIVIPIGLSDRVVVLLVASVKIMTPHFLLKHLWTHHARHVSLHHISHFLHSFLIF